MDKIEKLLFLAITNKQLIKFPNRDFLDTYASLIEEEQNEFDSLSREIHSIWNAINGPEVLNASNKYSDFDHFASEHDVSDKILQVMNEFNLTLRTEISNELKEAIIKHFGQAYYDENFGN